MKARLWALLSRVSRLLVWVLLRLVPARRHAVVHGWPDGEGNAVEMVRALARSYPGRIYWLLNDVTSSVPHFAQQDLACDRVFRLRKTSVPAVLRCLSAELTIFTHGLYTAVAQPADRLVVNVWHGDGPKSSRQMHLVRSSVVVAQTRLWGAQKADMFSVPSEAVALVGNPRIDQFDEVLPPATAGELGLVPGRCRVLWMPTYRQARGPRARSMSDGDHLTASSGVHDVVTALAEAAERLSMDLVVKPHPLDVDDYSSLPVRVLTDRDLDASGVSLYQLLGSCDALISDVSSVWVDYLVLDRPVAFYVPDLDELERRRGLNVPDFPALAPGPLLDSADDACSFLEQVAAGTAAPPSSSDSWPELGLVLGTGAADRLLLWLDDYHRSRGGRQLASPLSG